MGSCSSLFRAEFRPDHQHSVNGTTHVIVPLTHYNDDPIIKNGEKDFFVEAIPESVTEDISETDAISEDNLGVSDEVKHESLIVELVDLCITENVSLHNTGYFDAAKKTNPRLVVRRGTVFKLNFILNRPYNQETDVLCIVFTAKGVRNPSYSQRTEIVLPVLTVDENPVPAEEWHIQDIIILDDNCLSIMVMPSPNAIVGEWNVEVDSKLKYHIDSEAASFRYKVKDPVVILFNPWCEKDTVFMPDESHRAEYILCDSGLLWRGSHNCLRCCVWTYGQFEENVLECSLYLLSSVGHLNVTGRADPVRVVRHLSAVINSRDDSGVLAGNWSGKYKGGASPTSWCGSQCILRRFYKTKKPIKYGQCWVFSGVFTTVCRALGIPSRPVTNFSSAHDTHNSLTVDIFFDECGRPMDNLNIDSVWNFHVWTEVWMERPDLEPGGYGGWQAVDSTPQEESDGLYRCGPASVAAIKRGEVMKVYDTSFLFAEVNADKVYWKHRGHDQPLKLIRKSTEEIGKCISTKAVGCFEREDITNSYKYEESTKDEREVMLRALRQCKNAFSRYYLNNDLEEVKFELSFVDDIVIGESFTVVLKAKTKAEEEEDVVEKKQYTINVCLRVHSSLYTGCSKKLIKQDQFKVQIGQGVEEFITMAVNYSEYAKHLNDQCCFIISADAHVEETGFDYCAEDDFRVRMPDIIIQVDEEVIQNQSFTVVALFTNPLPERLKDGVFSIEGPGLGEPCVIKCKGRIDPGCEAKVTCKLTAKSLGVKTIAATFRSKELTDVDGYCQITVKPQIEVNEKENNSHL